MDNEIIQTYLTSIKDSNEYIDINKYIETFTEHEISVFKIAIDHLGTSFNIEKSIGYIKWKKDNKGK